MVREEIWSLSTQPAGQFVQFNTDATCIFVKYTLKSSNTAMWHFPSTGVAGMDLYGWDETNSTWRWTGTTVPSYPLTMNKLASFSIPSSPGERDDVTNGAAQARAQAHTRAAPRAYRLHLPTYMAIGDDVEIGTNPGAAVAADVTHLAARAPIIWYWFSPRTQAREHGWGRSIPPVFSRDGSLLPSIHADVSNVD